MSCLSHPGRIVPHLTKLRPALPAASYRVPPDLAASCHVGPAMLFQIVPCQDEPDRYRSYHTCHAGPKPTEPSQLRPAAALPIHTQTNRSLTSLPYHSQVA